MSTTGVLSFAPGQTSQTVYVTVLGDTIDELDETFSFMLKVPTNATIADNQGIGTIVDNDTAVLNINDVSVAEGNSGITTAGLHRQPVLAELADGHRELPEHARHGRRERFQRQRRQR